VDEVDWTGNMFRSMLVIILVWLKFSCTLTSQLLSTVHKVWRLHKTENDKAATEGFLGHSYTRVQNMECKSKPKDIFFCPAFHCSRGPMVFGFRIPTLYRTVLSAKRLNCKTEPKIEHHANLWSRNDHIDENVANIKNVMLFEPYL